MRSISVENLTVGAIVGLDNTLQQNKFVTRFFGRSVKNFGILSGDLNDGSVKGYLVVRQKITDLDNINESVSDDFLADAQINHQLIEVENDFTSVVTIEVEPDKVYAYQCGWFKVKKGEKGFDSLSSLTTPEEGKFSPEIKSEIKLSWNDIPIKLYKTLSTDKTKPTSIVFGSCRWMLQDRFVGSIANALFDVYGDTGSEENYFYYKTEGDKTYQAIVEKHVNKNPVSQVLMVGDQIYADDATNYYFPTTDLDDFLRQYRVTFNRPWIKELMSRIPTLMILDDHEIENNHEITAMQRKQLENDSLQANGFKAYSIYQDSHNPDLSLNKDGQLSNRHSEGKNYRFWYTYRDGCATFFVMDVRADRGDNSNIISDEQFKALRNWLEKEPNELVRCIVSSSPVFPSKEKDDINSDWIGAAKQRETLINNISGYYEDNLKDGNKHKVVILSGDFHQSFTTVLESKNIAKNYDLIQVISSPFFRPENSEYLGDPYELKSLEPGDDFKNYSAWSLITTPITNLISGGVSGIGQLASIFLKDIGLEQIFNLLSSRSVKQININGAIEKGGNIKMFERIVTPTKVINRNNFTRVDIEPESVTVKVYSQENEELDRSRFYFEREERNFELVSLECEQITQLTGGTGIDLVDDIIDNTVNFFTNRDEIRLEVLTDGYYLENNDEKLRENINDTQGIPGYFQYIRDEGFTKNDKIYFANEYANNNISQYNFPYNYKIVVRLYEEDRDIVFGTMLNDYFLGELVIIPGDEFDGDEITRIESSDGSETIEEDENNSGNGKIIKPGEETEINHDKKSKLIEKNYTFVDKSGEDSYRYTLTYRIGKSSDIPDSEKKQRSLRRTSDKVIISTLHYLGKDQSQQDEFVEIVNKDKDAIDISGWAIGGGKNESKLTSFVFPSGTAIASGEKIRVYAKKQDDNSFYIHQLNGKVRSITDKYIWIEEGGEARLIDASGRHGRQGKTVSTWVYDKSGNITGINNLYVNHIEEIK